MGLAHELGTRTERRDRTTTVARQRGAPNGTSGALDPAVWGTIPGVAPPSVGIGHVSVSSAQAILRTDQQDSPKQGAAAYRSSKSIIIVRGSTGDSTNPKCS